MKVAEILKAKGSGVHTINQHNTIREALRSMIENKMGSLVVIDPDFMPVGIITERDITRLIYQKESGDWQGMSVGEVMTKDIIVGVPEDDVDYIMALMTENRFRHMPIMVDNRLGGLISIGDVVKSVLKNTKAENRHLSDYISGKYPA